MYQVLAVKCGAVDDSTKKKRRTSEHFILIHFIHQTLPFKGMFLWLATSCCMYAVDALDQWSLAVSLGQSQSQVLQELVEGEVDLRSEVSRVVHGNDQHDVVGQHLKKKKITYVYDINWGVLILL